MNRLHVVLIVVTVLPLAALPILARGPRFTHKGTMKVDEAPFEPTGCSVLGSQTGIELVDARGARLRMLVPGQQVRLWTAQTGTPRVTWQPPGSAPVDIGTCGTLTVEGGGYHGQGKRAVSGHAAVSCSGPTPVWADLDFDGCF